MSSDWDYDELNEFQQSMYDEFGLSPDRSETISGGYFMREVGGGFDPKKYMVWAGDHGDGTYVVLVYEVNDNMRLGKLAMRSDVLDRAALFDVLDQVCGQADFSAVH